MSAKLRVIAFTAAALAIALVFAFPAAAADWNGGSDVIGCAKAGTTWYFAEGTTRGGFNEWLCVFNPNGTPTTATITYMLGTGQSINRSCPLGAGSRATIDVGSDVPPDNDVSIRVDCPDAIVAERAMYFRYKGTITGGHHAMGAGEPRSTWYFAEGTTRPGFEPYICIQNPGSSPADVNITFMLGDGGGKEQGVSIPAGSRKTVTVRDILGSADSAAHDFSARVEALGGAKVVAERPVYFNYKGSWTGGHDVVGAPEPGTAFYFAEGSTRPGFETYLSIMNPSEKAADVRITYMLADGNRREQPLSVPGLTRSTVFVNGVLGQEDKPSCDFSALVESTNGVGIVAERPAYFLYHGAWTGGHDVVGAGEPRSTWYFAEGTTRPGFEPYICVGNPGVEACDVNITYTLGDGGGRQQEVSIPAGSRRTVVVSETLGVMDDPAHDFSATVEALNGAKVVAERPMYFSYTSPARWSITAAGDVNLGGDVVPTLQANGFNWPWTALGEILSSSELTFANLECAISYRGSPLPGKTFTFRGPPDGLPPMRDAGVDVVSQANNHARDFGAVALTDSVGYLDSYGIGHCGAGADYNGAHAPAFLYAKGLRVAFLAYNDIGYDGIGGWQAGPGYPGIADAADTPQMAADIAAAKSQADLVAVSFHWGTERKYDPDPRQVQLAHYAVDCGADMVLGHHPHVAQGFEFYNGKPVAYSLGNFVFNPGSTEGHYTVMARFAMDARGFLSAEIYPVYINNCRPQLMGGSEADSLLGRVASLSRALGTTMTVSGGVGHIAR